MSANFLKGVVVFLCCLLLLYACDSNHDDHGAVLMLNGSRADARVDFKTTDEGPLIDIAQFMKAVGGRFVPLNMNKGIIAQYGKRIGFAANSFPLGMVQVQLCQMAPPSMEENGRLWAPRGFLEAVLENGRIEVNASENRINVTTQPPLSIGDIIPEARPLSDTLANMGYTVQQGDICLSNAIDICSAGYLPNANGNNANFPYLCIQPPLPPDADHALQPLQVAFTLREDEGLVLIGRTPPVCDYFSYRSYFGGFCPNQANPLERQKIYTQMGDPINRYNIGEDIYYPGPGGEKIEPFKSFFIMVSTPDRRLYQDVLSAAGGAGLDQDRVLLDIIDHHLVRLGNDDFADNMNFLHRFSKPHDQSAGEDYVNRPTLEILRLTPKTPRPADFLEPFPPRERGSGITENELIPAMEQLRQAIMDCYSDEYWISELKTRIWLGKTGREAIDAREDVLGETRDTLYLNTDSFKFHADTVVLVYGVNHAMIPKSIYNNVSCYGAKYANGFGGVTNDDYAGNVSRNIPLPDGVSEAEMEKLYVWKFARTELDDDTTAVPRDVDGNLKGINDGDDAFMAFRIYVDPDSPDLLGPDPDEIIFDQAVVLTPR